MSTAAERYVSNPFNGKSCSIMRELALLIRKGKLEVTKLEHHVDTFGAMNLVVNTRIPAGLHSRKRRKK